ncbi:MAG: FKBP-type peptidyl-prolyl cis-trans isomerase [Planctomycetota bacterium]|nr:FKBP-type peptidyl-prolyl cis-trans isomerase [Planctomycetota bacterium]
MKIATGIRVELDYELLDNKGGVIETSEEAGRIIYTHGGEEIPVPLEAALEGASTGDSREVSLAPEDAFGERDLESIFSVPTDMIGEGVTPRAGDWLEMNVEPEEDDDFTESYELEALVVSVEDDEVILDTNHPLAGQEVTFKVTVASVSTPE